jgi:MoaA/NifB/PqqE/SkfB family radical SAM enzyme
LRLRERIDGSVALRRAVWRLRRRPPGRVAPPARPVGAKLELTHSCNLRCGFCYTDSPRHTLARTPDLSDDAWRRIVEESIDLGIIEAVITGGEPLLRRELALEMLERLGEAGVGVNLNTNGWFVDDALADRLAALPALTVHLSIDGATPELHDAARGVPGSWRRAIEAAHRLLERGVHVQAVHVVTPDNQQGMEAYLEQMWVLGLTAVRLSPVGQAGAAARSGRWRVDPHSAQAVAQRFRRRHGAAMRVQVPDRPTHTLATIDRQAPAALLVRPGGAVLIDSLHPFAFGNAVRDGLGACWERIRAGWRDPRIVEWARGIRHAGDMHKAELVPYRDEEVDLAGADPAAAPAGASAEPPRLPRVSAPRPGGGPEAARARVRELALGRRYRLAPPRVGPEAGGGRYVRVVDAGRVLRLNPTAADVMDACDGGTAADVLARLSARYPAQPPARLELDALGAVRDLQRRGLVRPALAPAGGEPGPGAEPALGLVDL